MHLDGVCGGRHAFESPVWTRSRRFFDTVELSKWLAQLCDALDYAHNLAQIIHRDLKPANLMLTKRGELKVADFGIARSISDSMSMLTMEHGRSGTLVYMSPQQLDGAPGTLLDDIYSLGATIYELLTSRPPFYSGNIDRQIQERIAPAMSERRKELQILSAQIPIEWEKTVAACLAKGPAKRPQSVREIAARLTLSAPSSHRKSLGETIETRRRKQLQQSLSEAKPSRRRSLLIASAGALVLTALASWWFGTYQPTRKAHPLESGQDKAEATQLPTSPPSVRPARGQL